MRRWWERRKLSWRLAGLENRHDDMTGPEYCPPNACCPSCFHGGALDDVIEEIKALRQKLGLPPDLDRS